MILEELLLNDYGTIPRTIGLFLLKNDFSSFLQIQAGTMLSVEDLTDGLSLLIQRGMVKFFIFEKVCRYNIVKNMIRKRMYFPLYLHYVSQNYSLKYTKHFFTVMINGTYKETVDPANTVFDELITFGVLRIETFNVKASRATLCELPKQFKSSIRFLTLNFSFLDQKIFEEETIKYISKRYNEAAGSVLRSLLKCEVINRDNIISNLDSTKVLISDKGVLLNEKENVNEYLKYLCASGTISWGMDANRTHFFNTSNFALKAYRLSLLIKDPNMRRMFNMILDKPEIEDKDITIRSLLGINKMKTTLFSLQKLGLVSQKCIGDYSTSSKIEHLWLVDITFTCFSMLQRIENRIVEVLQKLNRYWALNPQDEDVASNSDVWTSDFISLAIDHLILSFGLNTP